MDDNCGSDYTCFGCLLMQFMEDNYSEENPLDLEEAIPVLTAMLADMVASLDSREDRRAATSDVVRWLKEGIRQARAPAKVKMVSGVVH